MASQAKVTSLDALESFRADLIIFLTTAHRSLDEVSDEVRRMRLWLQNDQRLHWEGQVRRRTKLLNEAKQELLSARMSGLHHTIATREMAVLKVKRALTEAEDKLRAVKIWNRDYDSSAEPLTKRLQGLRHFLDYDMPKAIAYLLHAQRTLEGYTEAPPPETVTVVPPAGPDASE
jgi:hypothetical protein